MRRLALWRSSRVRVPAAIGIGYLSGVLLGWGIIAGAVPVDVFARTLVVSLMVGLAVYALASAVRAVTQLLGGDL